MSDISFRKQPGSGGPVQTPDFLASDADRDRVADLLREAFGEGRLDAREHAERLEAAYAARTTGQLEPLLRDLPGGRWAGLGAASGRGPAPAPAAEQLLSLAAVFSAATRRGRWRVPRRIKAYACLGGVEIDLSEALFSHQEVVITAYCVLGGVDIAVPENVSVRGGGTGILGAFELELQEAGDPQAPVVVVRGAAVLGGVHVVARRGKRLRDLHKRRD